MPNVHVLETTFSLDDMLRRLATSETGGHLSVLLLTLVTSS